MLKKLSILASLAYTIFSLSTLSASAGFTCEKDNKVDLADDKICCCTTDLNSVDANDFNCAPATPTIGEDGNKKCPTGKTKISNQEKSCICHFTVKR